MKVPQKVITVLDKIIAIGGIVAIIVLLAKTARTHCEALNEGKDPEQLANDSQ